MLLRHTKITYPGTIPHDPGNDGHCVEDRHEVRINPICTIVFLAMMLSVCAACVKYLIWG